MCGRSACTVRREGRPGNRSFLPLSAAVGRATGVPGNGSLILPRLVPRKAIRRKQAILVAAAAGRRSFALPSFMRYRVFRSGMLLGDTGLEPESVTSDETKHLRKSNLPSAAKCAAPRARPADSIAASRHSGSATPDLARVVNAWPRLPDSIRQRIYGLVDAFELLAGGTNSTDQDRHVVGQDPQVGQGPEGGVTSVLEQDQSADARLGKSTGERSQTQRIGKEALQCPSQ